MIPGKKAVHICWLSIFVCCGLLIPEVGAGQIETNFEAGTFPQENEWVGDTSQFINDNDMLELNADPDLGDVSIAAPMDAFPDDSLEWEINLALDFPPSSSNRLRLYLAADDYPFSSSGEAFYLQIGERGSDDAIELYHEVDGETEKIFRSTDALARDHREDLRIRIEYHQPEWQLELDTLGTGLYYEETTGEADLDLETNFSGIRCFYTSTRADRFSFDRYYTGHARRDTTAPIIDSVKASSPQELRVEFSKPIISPNDTHTRFEVFPLEKSPDSVAFDQMIPNQAKLLFEDSLPVRESMALTVYELYDQSQNVNPSDTDSMIYFFPVRNEVIVNEIHFDPAEATELPDREFIELYNKTRRPVDISGWELANDNSSTELPSAEIGPDEHLILSPTTAVEDFNEYGRTLGVTNWPGFKVQEDEVTLRNDEGALMHHVSYERSWLDNDEKIDEGGWSLEMIDPRNSCGQDNNWRASEHSKGGTPGDRNSVKGENPNEAGPFLEEFTVHGQNRLSVRFDQPLDSLSAADPENYSIRPFGINPDSIAFNSPGFSNADLFFKDPLGVRREYTLSISSVEDCEGNESNESIAFGIPEKPERGDVLLNELLFNAPSGGNEFVEIYNNSDKFIDLNDLYLANKNEVSGELESVRLIAEEQEIMFPESYRVLTRDPEGVIPFYETGDEEGFLQISPFISMTNEEGNVYLTDGGADTIDRFHYHEDMHFEMLRDVSGVSLERTRHKRPTQNKNIWHSAAEQEGFATPGLPNSQQRGGLSIKDLCKVDPRVFSPQNPSLNDFTELVCEFEKPGYVVTVSVYDLNGGEQKVLANNKKAGTKNTFKWDGAGQEQGMLPYGTYLFLVETLNPEGRTDKVKIPVTLSD